MANEIEVFRITPKVGHCYQYIEATRSKHMPGGDHRYYSTNEPIYVGMFTKREYIPLGGNPLDIFNDGNEEHEVIHSYNRTTCFIEVECQVPGPGLQGGKRKSRRLHKKSKKTRGRR
jgi:hypothetical protein